MRLRLILSFSLIVFVTIVSVALIARQNTAEEVDRFVGRGGLMGLDSLVLRLESYYQSHNSWGGVESILKTPGSHGADSPGYGASGSNPRTQFQLVSADGNIVFDTLSGNSNTQLNQAQLEQALVLQVKDQLVGYLRVEGGMKISPEAQNMLVDRINDTALSAALIAGGISLVLALILATQLLRPIKDLTQASSHLAKGELSYRVPVRGKDATGFNRRYRPRITYSLGSAACPP